MKGNLVVTKIDSFVKEVSLPPAFERMYVSTYDKVEHPRIDADRTLKRTTGLYKSDN